jgi:hypothetical protein
MAKTDQLPSSIKDDQPALQFNVRISLRIRRNLDEYLEYMSLPLEKRPPDTEDWPDNLTQIANDALANWLAEHPRHPRKGPRNLIKKGEQ